MRLSNIRTRLANTSFYLLFPGFFFYHCAIAGDFLPPVLGGFFGNISVLVYVSISLLNATRPLRNISLPAWIFFAILILILFNSLSQYSLGNPRLLSKEVLVWSLSGLFFNAVCFMVASSMSIDNAARVLVPVSVLMALAVIGNVGDSGIFKLSDMRTANIASYQGLARSLVAGMLLTAAYYSDKGFIVYSGIVFGLLALFLNGARTEFAVYFISIAVFYFFYSAASLRLAISSFTFMLVIGFVARVLLDILPKSRMFELADISNSSSYKARGEFLRFGVKQVSENLFFGNYGAYTEIGGIGSYPHNLLSAWLNLGLAGFSLFVILFATLWFEAMKGFHKHRSNPSFKVFFIFLIFTTVAVTAAKTYNYQLIGLTIGFYVAYNKTCRNSSSWGKWLT
jgi:hypothetical protein